MLGFWLALHNIGELYPKQFLFRLINKNLAFFMMGLKLL